MIAFMKSLQFSYIQYDSFENFENLLISCINFDDFIHKFKDYKINL